MANQKKGFLLFKDSLSVLDDLSDEQAGKLFKAIKAHQLGEDFEFDALTKIAFSPFKSQFDRDDEKYEKTCKARAEAGSKGGLAKASKAKQKVAKGSKAKQGVANLADTDTKSDTDTDTDTDTDKDSDTGNKPIVAGAHVRVPYQDFVDLFNLVLGGELASVKVISEPRKKAIKRVWTEHPSGGWWNELFNHVKQSDFLMGRSSDWQASFDWILKPANFVKIVEGNYENRARPNAKQSVGGSTPFERACQQSQQLKQLHARAVGYTGQLLEVHDSPVLLPVGENPGSNAG